MSNLPIWARQPAHKKEVIATKRGWEVKETGELLRSVRDLPERLKELFKEVETFKKDVTVVEHSQDDSKSEETTEVESNKEDEKVEESEPEKIEEPQEEKPKRGRKPGRPKKTETKEA